MNGPREARSARAFLLSACCVVLASLTVVGDDGPEKSPFKVTFKSPGEGDPTPLKLGAKTKLPGIVRIERTGTAEPPKMMVISFIRLRDQALAGQFNASKKKVGPDTFEYEVELTAPPSPGKYDLITSLEGSSVSKPVVTLKVEVK